MAKKRPKFLGGNGIIGMVHLKPLPGSPRGGVDFNEIYRQAFQDGLTLKKGGVSALLVENYGDAPFLKNKVEPHVVGALSIVAYHLKEKTGLPVGVNCLRNDCISSMGAGACSGASFIRVNVFSGVIVTDQGIIEGCAGELLRYRRILGARVKVLADVNVKHGVPLAQMDPILSAVETVERGLADALILTGPATGTPVDMDILERTRKALPRVPLIVGSGVNPENIKDILGVADGVIVGTYFKEDGKIEKPVDIERVRDLVNSLM